MNGLSSIQKSRLGRRGFFKGAVVAGSALVMPGVSWFVSNEKKANGREVTSCLWFEHATLTDRYIPYLYELEEDRTLWVEQDDGYMHAFSMGQWKLEKAEVGHQLWLCESEEWYGYPCLSEMEADELLEDVV